MQSVGESRSPFGEEPNGLRTSLYRTSFAGLRVKLSAGKLWRALGSSSRRQLGRERSGQFCTLPPTQFRPQFRMSSGQPSGTRLAEFFRRPSYPALGEVGRLQHGGTDWAVMFLRKMGAVRVSAPATRKEGQSPGATHRIRCGTAPFSGVAESRFPHGSGCRGRESAAGSRPPAC